MHIPENMINSCMQRVIHRVCATLGQSINQFNRSITLSVHVQ